MNSKTRLLKTWSFQEPDRVPLEMEAYPSDEGLPEMQKILEFQRNEADNFIPTTGFDWGFMGLDSTYAEEVIEDIPGKYKRIARTFTTSVGQFTAITKHNYGELDPNDYHWEKRYFEEIDDFRRLAEADRKIRPFNREQYNKDCEGIGLRGLPVTGLFHPLGVLVRFSNMEEVYMWLMEEEKLTLNFLETSCTQVIDTVLSLADQSLVEPPMFVTYALEMLIPPWMGMYHFDKLVFPFDKKVNEAVHKIDGRHRAHCHGNTAAYLERFADMGIDGTEPLEPPPYGDNLLADAKKLVGDRLVLSGNIPSQAFNLDSFRIEDVRPLVKRAIEDGKRGGGFSLRTTGGAVGGGKTREQTIKCIQCNLALIDAWREFGGY
jgi:hypothetical protein